MTISINDINYITIQQAVDAALDGQTILVSAGTYREQVTVSGKNITIQGAGAGQTFIEAPNAASLVANASDTNATRPTKYAVIAVTNNADVTIAGVTVDGRDQGSIPSPPTNYDFLGIYVLNSDAHIDGVAVTGADELAGVDVSGVQRNHGILVTGHNTAHGGSDAGYAVEIENSTVSGFQKNGIFVNGSTLTANIHDNTITGVHTSNTAQNGIQVGSLFGAVGDGDFSGTHATVDHNTITNIGNNGPAGSASGIIVFAGNASGVSITNNTLTGWASPHPSNGNSGIAFVDSNGGTVTGNTISAFDYGLTEINAFGGHLTTPFTHSGNTYTGNYQANILLSPDTSTGITFAGSTGHDELHGGTGADALSGGAGNDTIIGGAGTDTATGYGAGYHLAIQGGHWVVTNGSETDQLTGVEQVVINGTTYLLVDQFGANGGYQHVQDAINAASGAATILIAPGTYTESGSDGIGHTVGLYINKPNLTLLGVDANGALITTSNGAVANGATIISGHQAGFGANHWVDFGGDGTIIQGLHLQAGVETNNKLLEIWGDNVTVKNSVVDIHHGGTVDTKASAIYINDNGTTSSEISSYAITGNVLNGAIVVANGVGDPSTHQFGATQLITNNRFEGTFDYNTGLGRYTDIVLNGQSAGTPWLLAPTQIPTITGNTFSDNSTPIILRGLDDDRANFPTVSQVDQILAANGDNNTTYAYVIDPSSGLLRTDDPIIGGGTSSNPTSIATHRFIVANSTDTLNLALDTTPDAVFGGQRGYIHDGDTVVVQSGATGTVNSAIMVDNLTVKATAHSTDLNLTLATHLVDGTAIAGGGVHNITIADYAPGQGANVDVTGNALVNVITGNSGNNVITGGGGDDTVSGAGGNDTFRYVLGTDGADVIDGGAGSDTLDYTGTASAVSVDLGMHTAPGVGSFTSIENVTGGSAGDTLTGDSGANILTGGGGNDTLDGKGETDTAVYAGPLDQSALTAIAGHWEVNRGVGDTDTLQNIEIVQHGGGRYLLVGNGGFADATTAVEAATQAGDTIVFAAPLPPDNPIVIDVTNTNEDIDITIPYDVDVDIVTGGGDNHITTGDGDNDITTGGGDNEIVTGGGDNHITTGGGDNEIATGDGNNEIATGNGNNDIVTGDGDNAIVTGDGNNDIVTGDGDNAIVTGDGDNEIVTGDGDNEIVTGNGDNDIATGNGENHVVTGAGTDHVTTGSGGDTVKTGGGNDVVDTGGGADTIIGGSGNGDDVYDAGIGSDTVVYSSATNGITVDLTQIDRFNQPASGGGTIGDLLTAALLDPHTPVGKSEGVDIGTDALINIDNVIGGAGNDSITGDSGANILTGAGGNDILNGGAGADTLDGGSGLDTAVFSGLRSAYTIMRSGNTLAVSGPDGSDTLTHIERLSFADGTVSSGLAPAHSDFSGDGNSDVVWRQDDSGQVYFWGMTGLQTNGEGSVAHAAVTNDWHAEDTGDFNGDGNSDILWRQDGTGQVYIWEMDGQQVEAEGAVAHAAVTNDWQVEGIGDFNGDGNSDILWRQDGGGQVYIWEMDGQQVQAEGAVAHAAVTNDWQVQGIGDFNGDGNSDVLWRQGGGGQIYVWEMNGQQVQAEGAVAHAAVTNDWQVEGIGDFNGDGNSDILWRQDGSGQVYVWEMNGQQVQAESVVAHAAVTNDWHVQSVGDFNGDGNSDVLWRQDGSGQIYVWEMEASQVKAEGAVAHAPVTNDWHVFG